MTFYEGINAWYELKPQIESYPPGNCGRLMSFLVRGASWTLALSDAELTDIKNVIASGRIDLAASITVDHIHLQHPHLRDNPPRPQSYDCEMCETRAMLSGVRKREKRYWDLPVNTNNADQFITGTIIYNGQRTDSATTTCMAAVDGSVVVRPQEDWYSF